MILHDNGICYVPTYDTNRIWCTGFCFWNGWSICRTITFSCFVFSFSNAWIALTFLFLLNLLYYSMKVFLFEFPGPFYFGKHLPIFFGEKVSFFNMTIWIFSFLFDCLLISIGSVCYWTHFPPFQKTFFII